MGQGRSGRGLRVARRMAWVAALALALPVALGLGAGAARPVAAQEALPMAPATVPVLIYHNIEPTPGTYTVTPAQLEEQLIWLRDNGYVGITPSQLLAAQHGGPLPAKPVMLTIDDGWASQYQFVELVNHYGFRASYFLPNYAAFTPAEIAALHASGEVCGHTVNHPYLDQLSYEQQFQEIHDNKVWLEGIVGGPVRCFAYPFGAFNDDTVNAVAASGYEIAFKVAGGPAPAVGIQPLLVPRINVNGAYPLADFIAVINGAPGY